MLQRDVRRKMQLCMWCSDKAFSSCSSKLASKLQLTQAIILSPMSACLTEWEAQQI